MGRVLVGVALLVMSVFAAGGTQTSGSATAPPSVVPTMSGTETATAAVRTSVQDKLDSDPDLSKLKLKVVDVVLVNKVGNEYKGMVTVKTSAGKRHDVAIDVTADGDNVIWETTSPGAFAFAAQEEPASPPPAQPAVAPPLGPNSLPVRNGMAYIVTKSGKTRCQISRFEVDCQAPLSTPRSSTAIRPTACDFSRTDRCSGYLAIWATSP